MPGGAHDDAYKYYKGRPPYSPKAIGRLAVGLKFNDETRILDIACGNGSLSQVIAPHIGHITGLDVSKGMLSIAFQDPKIRYVEWDFNRQPPYRESKRFHHIVVGRALQWLSFQTLSDTFKESVEPGGSLVICDSRFDRSGWYLNFRSLLQNYGRFRSEPGHRTQKKLPLIGFRHQGTITERFQAKLTADFVLLHALSIQPVTRAIEANLPEFKSRLAALLRPAMSDGVVTVDCTTSADAWLR